MELEIHRAKNYKPDSESQRWHLYGNEIYVYSYIYKAEKWKGAVVEEEGEQERQKGVLKSDYGQSMRYACVTMSSGNLKPHPLCPKLFGPNHGGENGSLDS